ncbi:MAG TPA: TerC family protein [Longimicrobiales bacterium]|nr:TerC family protein [Longimicrobiales bacterium]
MFAAASPFALVTAAAHTGAQVDIGLWTWLGFNAFIVTMLALDLGVFHRNAHEVKVREATTWTAVWVALALLFCLWIYHRAGPDVALAFLTGYLIEKSLSVDNVFVMVMIFSFFAVPARYQHRVLFWGVLGALVMRGAFIGMGAYVLHRWHPVIFIFGGLLVVTGVKMALKKDEEPDLNANAVVRIARRMIRVSHGYHQHHFVVREAGRLVATPLLLVLLLIEASDVLFAVDSIPAIFAITDDAFIVYTSNVFAILGLRSMYFMLGDVVHRFAYLKYGLAVVLVFIGTKMLIMDLYQVPTAISLLVVATVISLSIVLSAVHAARMASAQPGADDVAEELLPLAAAAGVVAARERARH